MQIFKTLNQPSFISNFRYSTVVNATDKWGFTPLHEAAQKGRTQLCALLLAHGADPTLKNQEGQTPLDLCSADDVKCLLQDAMPTTLALPTTTKNTGMANFWFKIFRPKNQLIIFCNPSGTPYRVGGGSNLNLE